MKRILTLAFAVAAVSAYGQKEEISAAEKAFNSGDYKTALEQADKAQDLISKNKTIKPEDVAKVLNFKALALQKNSGDKNAVPLFCELIAFEKGYSYAAKNKEDKKTYYFNTQKEMDAAVGSGAYEKPKTTPRVKKYTEAAIQAVRNIAVSSQQEAINAYNSSKFDDASELFDLAFNTQTCFVDKPDTSLVLNSAIAQINDENFSKAADYYKKLIDLNYTGIAPVYQAKDKTTGELRTFQNKGEMDAEVKLGLVTSPEVLQAPNRQPDIYLTLAQIYYQEGHIDECLAICQAATEKYPEKQDLVLLQGQIFYERKDLDKFLDVLRKVIVKEPKNPTFLFNYGVVSNEKGDVKTALEYLQKTIDVDPNYVNAYINMAGIILEPEQKINEEIDKLPYNMNKTQAKQYEDLKKQKMELYKKALTYLLKAYEIAPENRQVVTTLKNIYYVLEDTAAYDKFDKIDQALQAS